MEEEDSETEAGAMSYRILQTLERDFNFILFLIEKFCV